MERKVDRILLGQQYSMEELTRRYSIGYVIFKLEYKEPRIDFYKTRTQIENYKFDWSKVEYTNNTPESFGLMMPDIQQQVGTKLSIKRNEFAGPKKVGWSFTYYMARDFAVVCQVLDKDENGIVFLIGLLPKP
jgi:hypothetical protein